MAFCFAPLRKNRAIRGSAIASLLHFVPQRLRRHSYPCHEVQAVHVSAHVNKRVLRSKISQHTAGYANPCHVFYCIKNIDFYQKLKDFMQLKARNFLCFSSRFYSVNLYLSSKFYKPNLCFSSMFHSQNLCLSSRKLTFFDFYEETAASAIRIVLYSIPSGETASRSFRVPLTVIFCPGSMPAIFALSNSSPCAQHARTSVMMQ